MVVVEKIRENAKMRKTSVTWATMMKNGWDKKKKKKLATAKVEMEAQEEMKQKRWRKEDKSARSDEWIRNKMQLE
jgi:hypothetical protein